MFTTSRSSPKALIEVASPPSSSFSLQTNPGAASAAAFTGSSAATNSASNGESTGSRGRAMFSCAR